MKSLTSIEPDIKKLRDLIVELINPDKIILFGSYAYGEPTEKSDIDLLVIKNGIEHTIEEEAKLATAIYYKTKELGISLVCDAFLENETYVNKNAQSGGTYADALERGMVLYAR